MSSDTRPYKSRLFNFINRQSLRWKEQRDRALRRLKTSATWGTQILLYPLYLLVQSGRSVGRAFGQTVQQQKLRLQGKTQQTKEDLAVDTPIYNVLQALDKALIAQEIPTAMLPSPQPALLKEGEQATSPTNTENSENNSLSKLIPTPPTEITQKQDTSNETEISAFTQSPSELEDLESDAGSNLDTTSQGENQLKIQGVASLLENKSLVLITLTNQILDILSPPQQQQLQQRITWEIANYSRKLRLHYHTRQSPLNLPIHNLNNSKLLPPLRWFWGMIAWMQQGQIAISANLFNEAVLATTSPPVNFSLIPNQFSFRFTSPDAIARLDNTIAAIEAQPLLPVEKLALTVRQQTQKVITKSNSNPTEITTTQTDTESLSHSTPNAISESNKHLDNQSEDPYSLAVLIRAAIDYFFKPKHQPLQTKEETPISELLPEENPSPNFFQKAKQTFALAGQSSPKIEDPWLSWEDLYGDVSYPQPADSPTPPQSLPQATPTPPKATPLGKLKQQLQRQTNTGKLRKRRAKQGSDHKIAKKSSNRKETSQLSPAEIIAIEKAKRNPDTNIEPSPDWLEAEATPVGYVKHPLEKILEWLDRIMVAIEEWIVNVARSLFNR